LEQKLQLWIRFAEFGGDGDRCERDDDLPEDTEEGGAECVDEGPAVLDVERVDRAALPVEAAVGVVVVAVVAVDADAKDKPEQAESIDDTESLEPDRATGPWPWPWPHSRVEVGVASSRSSRERASSSSSVTSPACTTGDAMISTGVGDLSVRTLRISE